MTTVENLQASPSFKPSFIKQLQKGSRASTKNSASNFNFDLDRMKKTVNAKSFKMPESINSFEEFDAWMNQL